MLMKLLWWLVGPIIRGIVHLLPNAPGPVEITLPWPAAVPFYPFAVVILSIVMVGTATLALRFARWIYGMVPIVQ